MKLHLSPMISSARDTELGRPSMNRLPSEARLVFRPGFAGSAAGAGAVAILHAARFELGSALRTGDDRVAFAAAGPVHQNERWALSAGEPAVAELHQGDEARIEIKAHLRQTVLLALSDIGRDLPEDLQARQLSQPVGQRRARNVERRTKRLEGPGLEEGLANDEKRPSIRNDVERPRDRAVSLALGRDSRPLPAAAGPAAWPVPEQFLRSPNAPSRLHPGFGGALRAAAPCDRHAVALRGKELPIQCGILHHPD